MFENIVFVFFILLLAHYLIFLTRIYTGLSRLKKSDSNILPEEFISVIIPFRNESDKILLNLKSIENQNYPKEKFEVIYVNDSSDDDSLKILLENKSSDNITILSVPKDYSTNAHKKRAIRYGIEHSNGEIVITTDADCVYENDWLKSLLNNFDNETGFVSGPVEFIESRKLFSKIQKIEFAGLVLTGAGLIGSGNPIICNAANIAYRKKAFEAVNGFKDNMNLSSGDDEFLMQKISRDTAQKVKFSLDEISIVKTDVNKNIREFYHQRKRWASKGLFYADNSLVVKLILIYLFYVGLVVQLFLAIFLSALFWISLFISISAKLFFEYLIMKRGKKKLFKNLSLKSFLITEILQIPYIIFAGLLGSFGNLIWKDRRLSR
jgi:cellulose synthase/poly-beta-1,6-N-acetylglucosamine synthase-like glycosyltransferase